jgi:phosphate transport system protein
MVNYLNAYERTLIEIGKALEQMGQVVAVQLTEAMQAFTAQDTGLAQVIVDRDDEVDLHDENIEREALELISLQQPVDYDLRFLNAAMRISRELERISDYSCDIAEAVIQLQQAKPFFKPLTDLNKMAGLVQDMLVKSLKAHFAKDLSAAGEMDDDDQAVDEIFTTLVRELVDYMRESPEYIEQASVILLVVRYLERIGDHVVNIAEMTIFMETGERHPYKKKLEGTQKIK